MKHASEFDENKASSRLIKVCEHYQVEKVRGTKITYLSFTIAYLFSNLLQSIHAP